MGQINHPQPRGIGGWLFVLCACLLVWGPVGLGLVASNTLDALPVRGLPLGMMLLARVFVTAFGIAAGIALAARRGPAVLIAKTSLVLSAATDLVVYTTPYFPSNRMPGDTPFYVAASLTYHGLWLAYLFHSKRVKSTYL